MLRNYCTLYDKNYLFQGMALFVSLLRHAGDFRLYVICMDPESYAVVEKLAAKYPIIPVGEPDLRAAMPELEAHKQRSSHGQYCWSCQPFSVAYLLERFQLDGITYLEADSIFFSSPEALFTEIGAGSVSLVPHRYTPEFDQTAKSGRYCVQSNFFRNDVLAGEVLRYWQNACLEYSKARPLYHPGQTNLDAWCAKFGPAVVEIQNIGAGVAPWNVQQYAITQQGDIPLVDGKPCVFYHYHEFAFLEDGRFDLGGYPLSAAAVDAFYRPYKKTLSEAEQLVRTVAPDFHHRRVKKLPMGFLPSLRKFKSKILGRYNIYRAESL